MTALVMPVWIAAMMAGLCWARWAVAALSAVAVVLAALCSPMSLSAPVWWLQLLAVGATPWLLAAQRRRHEQRLKRLQARESYKLASLQEQSHGLLRLQRNNEQRENAITQITNLYHVTKATAKALHVTELFGFAAELAPRLLDAKGLRLIDTRHQVEGAPLVLRASRAGDGRLVPDPGGAISPEEQAILQQATEAPKASVSAASTLAWAPVWGEHQSIGVLIADELPPAELDTLAIVANQLSLQLTRVHLYEAIESMAITDTLTELLVRRYFLELASNELERSARHALPCTLIMADLDLFKTKNDTYGHLVGDVVLRDVAQLIRKNLRGIDLIARYGGEEFILMLVETGAEQAMLIAERLRQLVEVHPIRAYDETLRQTVSFGLASFPDDAQTVEDLIARADDALYAAKRGGRNRVIRWKDNLRSV